MSTEKRIGIWALIPKNMLEHASLLLCFYIFSKLSSKHMSKAPTD